MAIIEGKDSREWFKAAAQRQKRSNAYAKYEPEPEKPKAAPAMAQPARQEGSMPKPQQHASPAPAPKPTSQRDYKKEAADDATKRVTEAMEMAKAFQRENARRQPEIEARNRKYQESQDKAKADAAKGQAHYAAAQRRLDERAASPGPVKVAKAAGEAVKAAAAPIGAVGGGLIEAAKEAARINKRAYSSVGRAGYRWLTGDPEAKKRLASKP